LIEETPGGLQAIEIKSGTTFSSDWLRNGGRPQENRPQAARSFMAVIKVMNAARRM
jgi:hypothetical protein